jgi:hypothetical protein
VRLVGGHLAECVDLGSESTNNGSGAHQVIVVDREEHEVSYHQVYISIHPHPSTLTRQRCRERHNHVPKSSLPLDSLSHHHNPCWYHI